MKYDLKKLASGLIKVIKSNGQINYYTASTNISAISQGDGIVAITTDTRKDVITPTGWGEIEIDGNDFASEELLMEALNTFFF